jgi:aerobic carbon-monoxide dehydrogenase medium subunit
MKPTSFIYHTPNTIDEAAKLLASDPNDSKLLAGGQSLVPMLNLRVVRFGNLVDINRIPGLNHVRVEPASIAIGALARHYDVESSKEVGSALPLLPAALAHVAHSQIRNRGTVVGSICHADPAAEMPAVWLAVGGELTALSTTEIRTIRAEDFFISTYTTTLKPDEVVTEVRFNRTKANTGWSFDEVNMRHGNFALVGAVNLVTLDGGSVSDARLVSFGTGEKPIRIPAAEKRLIGTRASAVDDALLNAIAADVSAAVDPTDDVHATIEYRRYVAGVLARRGLRQALERAQSRA